MRSSAQIQEITRAQYAAWKETLRQREKFFQASEREARISQENYEKNGPTSGNLILWAVSGNEKAVLLLLSNIKKFVTDWVLGGCPQVRRQHVICLNLPDSA